MKFCHVEDYYRQETFDFFAEYPDPYYSISFDLDVTEVKAFAKASGLPVYRSLCYFFTLAMGRIEDFRYRLRNGRLVLYDALHIGMTVPAPGRRFSFVHLHFDEDHETFRRLADEQEDLGRQRAVLDQEEHTNYIYFTAIPKVPFTSFAHAPGRERTDGAPRVAFGHFFDRGGRLWVPVGITINHLFIDGVALGELYEGLCQVFANPARPSENAV